MELQKSSFRKSQNEAKKVAELHISELEEELENCQKSGHLQLERATTSLAREKRRCKQLTSEKEQLDETLTQVCSPNARVDS